VNGRRVPHFQLVVGGQWTNNAGSYGLAIGAVPSKRVPEVVKRLTARFAAERQNDETFAAFVNRIGKKTIRAMVEELQVLPSYEADRSNYSDWGDPREYTIEDMGVGECAGEVVPIVEMGLAGAEREIFEAQVLLDDAKPKEAVARAYSAMLEAARALTREKNPNLGTDPNEIVSEFRRHFCDTQLFYDPYAGAKFAQYFFRVHEEHGSADSPESVHQLIEEATLFVDAAHQCYARLGASLGAPAPGLGISVSPTTTTGPGA
jgi:sulfite reductase (ferredoxin)